jgi:hypothetical protein
MRSARRDEPRLPLDSFNDRERRESIAAAIPLHSSPLRLDNLKTTEYLLKTHDSDCAVLDADDARCGQAHSCPHAFRVAGGLLASLMIIIGVYTSLVRAKGPSPVPDVNPLAFLTIPLGDMLLFGILVGAALYFRRRADTHKRLMLLATIAILPAAVARLPIGFIETGGPLVFFGLSDLFILPLLVFDIITRGRPHRATLLGGALIVISHPLRMVIGGTQAWLAFATWLTQGRELTHLVQFLN